MVNNKIKFALAAGAALLYCCIGAIASPQDDDDKKKDPTTLASEEAERMAKTYNLDDAQLFYIDSILCHDYAAMIAECEKLSKAKVENYELYGTIQDKWYEQMDNAIKKVMTPEQWAQYLKQGGEKRAKERAKRREKAENATADVKKGKKNK